MSETLAEPARTGPDAAALKRLDTAQNALTTARAIRTARGGRWQVSNVRNLLARAGQGV